MTNLADQNDYCWSWAHAGLTPSVPGSFMCSEHVAEEAVCRGVTGELLVVAEDVQKFLALPSRRRSGELAKHMVEGPLRLFFGDRADIRVRPGVRDAQRANDGAVQGGDLDITVTFAEEEAPSVGGRFRDHYEESRGVPLRGHMEVKSAASGRSWSRLSEEIQKDLQKLQTSIDSAAHARSTKPWTGLILLGPDWGRYEAEIIECARSFYVGKALDLVVPEGLDEKAGWWPFVDVITAPGLLLKKHQVFERPSPDAIAHPVWARWDPSPHDPLHDWRPLAIARGFLSHHLDGLQRGLGVTPAWDDSLTAAYCGPKPRPTDFPVSETYFGSIASIAMDSFPGLHAFHANNTDASSFLVVGRGGGSEEHMWILPERIEGGCLRRRSGVMQPIPGLPQLLHVVGAGQASYRPR